MRRWSHSKIAQARAMSPAPIQAFRSWPRPVAGSMAVMAGSSTPPFDRRHQPRLLKSRIAWRASLRWRAAPGCGPRPPASGASDPCAASLRRVRRSGRGCGGSCCPSSPMAVHGLADIGWLVGVGEGDAEGVAASLRAARARRRRSSRRVSRSLRARVTCPLRTATWRCGLAVAVLMRSPARDGGGRPGRAVRPGARR